MISKFEKIMLAAGMILIFMQLLFVSMPTERIVWLPQEGYSLNPNLQGEGQSIIYQAPQSELAIEQKTGLTAISFNSFQKRFNGKQIEINGRKDGRVMYVQSEEKFFAMKDYKPNMFTTLEADGIMQKGDGTVVMKYSRGIMFPWVMALEFSIWAVIVFLTSDWAIGKSNLYVRG